MAGAEGAFVACMGFACCDDIGWGWHPLVHTGGCG